MSDAIKLRKKWLKNADKIMDEYKARTLGKPKHAQIDAKLMLNYIDSIMPIIQQADDPVPIAKLTDGDISKRVDRVLKKVARGDITPKQGKEYIALLQAGFDMTELPKLLASFEELQSK